MPGDSNCDRPLLGNEARSDPQNVIIFGDRGVKLQMCEFLCAIGELRYQQLSRRGRYGRRGRTRAGTQAHAIQDRPHRRQRSDRGENTQPCATPRALQDIDLEIPDDILSSLSFVIAAMLPLTEGSQLSFPELNEAGGFKAEGNATATVKAMEKVAGRKLDMDALRWRLDLSK